MTRDLTLEVKKKMWRLILSLLWYLPKDQAHGIFYWLKTGKKLDLNEPKTINEKIQWLLVNKYGKEESSYADKLLVRDYINELGYGDFLPKILGTYDSVDDIDRDQLPDKFVLKLNHGSGPDYYSLCLDKKNFDWQGELKKLSRSMKKDFARVSLEYHYSFIKPRLYCEEFLEDGSGHQPMDYKIFCFHGQAQAILVTSGREQELKRDYYDLDWNYMALTKEGYRSCFKHEKPKNLQKMIELAQDISKPFAFARIDFYNLNGRIVFGEITLSPAAGANLTYNDYGLYYLGNLIDLSRL